MWPTVKNVFEMRSRERCRQIKRRGPVVRRRQSLEDVKLFEVAPSKVDDFKKAASKKRRKLDIAFTV